MRFSATNVLAILSATASIAAATPTGLYNPSPNAAVAVDVAIEQPETSEVQAIEKREIITAIVTAAGTAAATAIAKIAVEAAADLIKKVANWENAREQFTKATVSQMWAQNPDRARFPAAVCYNKAYDLRNPRGMDGLTSVKLTSGPLKVTYDCFYMTGNNALWTRGDGGFINLAVMSDKSRCTFDRSTSDLTCR